MGFFRDLIKVAAPIAGSFFGPVGTAIGAGVSGYLSKQDQAKEQQRAAAEAGKTALGGFNYINQSPVGTQYVPAGGAAIGQESALLGIGGDPAASRQAYQNYLNSIGYRGQLQAGQQAITTSRAAAGLLGSGSTAKALTRFGQQLNAQSFDNYLAHLHGVAGMGLQGAGMISNAANQGYGEAGRFQYGAGMESADSKQGGWEQLLGGLGTAYDAWKVGKAKKAA